MRVKYHDNDKELYCVHCKEVIEFGDKYIVTEEKDTYGKFKKYYHLDCYEAVSDELEDLENDDCESDYTDEIDLDE